ncbi:MAG: hypothetical protein ACRCST_09580 [Turicibacter sp.]
MSTKETKTKNKLNHNDMQSSPKNMFMDVEFGTELVGDAQRAARAVQTRVKNTAQRYGIHHEE